MWQGTGMEEEINEILKESLDLVKKKLKGLVT